MFWKIFLSWLLFPMAFHGIEEPQQPYVVGQTFVLSQKTNGLNGKIELLMDTRLIPSIREQLWGKGDWTLVLPPDSKLFRDFSAVPPRKAKLVIRDEAGRTIVQRGLDTPLAELKEWNPVQHAKGGYLLTIDYSAGVGSYSGPRTSLLQVSKGVIHDVYAVNAATRQHEPIRLVKSLKSGWKVETSSGQPELLSLSCHTGNDGNFVLEFVRYRFNGTHWLEYRRQQPGFWESDNAFPPRSAFP